MKHTFPDKGAGNDESYLETAYPLNIANLNKLIDKLENGSVKEIVAEGPERNPFLMKRLCEHCRKLIRRRFSRQDIHFLRSFRHHRQCDLRFYQVVTYRDGSN